MDAKGRDNVMSGLGIAGMSFASNLLLKWLENAKSKDQQLGVASAQLDNSNAVIKELETSAAIVQQSNAVVLRASGSQITRDLSAPINKDDGFRRSD